MADQQPTQQPPQQQEQQLPQQLDLQQQLADLRQLVSDQQQLLDDLCHRNQVHDQPEAVQPALGAAAASIQANDAFIRDSNFRLQAQHFQVDIDHYNHPSTSGDPEKWMSRFEILTNEVGWNDARRTCCLPSYLNNQAKKWYNHCQHNEWPKIRQAFVAHFRTTFGERTEYEALKYDPREPITKFIDTKEEKAADAGIPENQAVDHLIIHANLPYEYAISLAAQTIPTFADLKRAINKMTMVRDRHSRQNAPNYANAVRGSGFAQDRPSFRSSFRSSYRPPPYNRPPPARNAHYGERPPPCPECRRRGFERHHWLSDCLYRQQNTSAAHATTATNRRPAAGITRPPQNRGINILEVNELPENRQQQQQQTNPN